MLLAVNGEGASFALPGLGPRLPLGRAEWEEIKGGRGGGVSAASRVPGCHCPTLSQKQRAVRPLEERPG